MRAGSERIWSPCSRQVGPGYDVYVSTIKRMSALLLELQAMLLVKTVKNGEVRLHSKFRVPH